ncbi:MULTISPECIES: ATP synthase F1 subunit epsilon [unclassified Roseofilum]|uniref:ATP synthase F1 subunit epsilon n=1 Tax=unclassified Roseofilum TaxID=2620099 RepID=UPI001B206418|nr:MULTISPECIES: ATP synthase F1 subunit epsilon [unclassified Roseofilum]MBP0010660.1 F0F1 ATP synthase subunit epsilon [Roseofilum sp. Belize Diploria]MBP0014356.1 F0F1 ATP synthase subunit epsilon [Roseofilum sp. SID3]MBP0022521.1 F0F1 ATP synthase subunit epsilon [Roseofilum sp. SID2]MBP0038806.1 F0F1 ATP synthase subunit epsilon [Roseofilum sp. SID1]MBP0042213.1 F0F1 ATP synthase subunit epsilon [Roseofilum sp. SBFL]
MTLKVRVIASNKTVWDDVADEVILPSTTGQLGILSGHAPLLSALDIGVMQVRPQSQKEWLPIALMGGFAEVDDDEVTILVNGGALGGDINLEEAESAYQKAQERLSKVNVDDRQEQFQATQALKRARAKFQAAGGMVKL